MGIITPQPLHPEAFTPFGDVIQAGLGEVSRVNDGRADRFDSGARLGVTPGGRSASRSFSSTCERAK